MKSFLLFLMFVTSGMSDTVETCFRAMADSDMKTVESTLSQEFKKDVSMEKLRQFADSLQHNLQIQQLLGEMRQREGYSSPSRFIQVSSVSMKTSSEPMKDECPSTSIQG